jgi:uncharacterized protein with HEPN domain
MPPEERDAAYLWDMLQATRDLMDFTQGVTFAAYSSNKMMRMAVERGFQVLGDAGRRVSENLKAEHPEIPWSSVVKHRNVIVHDYADLSLERIWEVIQRALPVLARDLERLVATEPLTED